MQNDNPFHNIVFSYKRRCNIFLSKPIKEKSYKKQNGSLFYIRKKEKKKESFFMNNTTICNVAFFDAEFTARTAKDRGIPEMIQCAFLVYSVTVSEHGDLLDIAPAPIKTYQTFVKPIYMNMLSEYIKELTGITQKNVDDGKKFKEAIDDIYNFIRQYNLKMIVTWGPDKGMLKKNFYFQNYDRRKVGEILDLFNDVSFKLSQMYGYGYPISQSNMCKLLNVKENGTHHDAYNDAVNLSRIIKAICNK